ncbi:outer membrane protein [Sphingomonas sp. S2-65]|uniref:outer membrane protein n=1 Tax=Sphingomonas sp. S2-65 TaxID=2903960 RepID=UPI001F24F409|nr:porin family protein [Sphingomonas sp. S2-65]UYY57147.1 porin family protein [Sphingomonas sp. S2-65]
MKKIVLGFAALVAAQPAFAQDQAAAVSFSGARIEARVGLDHPTISLEATDGVDSIDESVGKSGIAYGGEIGFDAMMSINSFAGVYAGVEGASTKECTEVYGGDEACLKAGRNFTAGVRGGFVLGTSTALYAKGGYSNGRVRITYEDPAFPEDNFDLGDNLDGFHVGAGVEFSRGRFYGKLEYAYTNYGDYEYEDEDLGAALDLDRHQVVAGVGLRF